MTTPPPGKRLLIIDDDLDIWQAYGQVLAPSQPDTNSALTKLGKLIGNQSLDNQPIFRLDYAGQGQDGFTLVQQAISDQQPFSIAFIDIRMPPGWDGLQTATRIREIDHDIEIVIVTAYSDRTREEIASAVGACDKLLFIRKPFDAEELMQLAVSLTEKWQTNHDLQRTAKALQASENRFRSLVEATSDWVWEMDSNGCFTYCSPLCHQIYGYQPEELLGHCFYDILVPPENRDEMRVIFQSCLNNAQPCPAMERPCQRQDGSIIYVESSSVPILADNGQIIGYRGIDRDISIRKQQEAEMHFMEEQQRQSQKLSALGTLAGGIAHDMNNILTPILGFSELAMEQTDSKSQIYNQLQNIHDCGNKAADLIRQILAFTRKQPLEIITIDLNKIIKNFYKMLRRLIREDIELILALQPDLWPVEADRSQMEQVLVNLIVNARDAMETCGQAITISTTQKTIAANSVYAVNHQPVKAGDYVILQVHDEGTGMGQQTQEKAFDPFFTTKDAGKGTGLGLSTVYGIIGQHDGYIQLDSSAAQGTTFLIFLPRTFREKDTSKEHKEEKHSLPKGKETILLVEDNQDVRAMADNALKSLGYQVITVANGKQGLDIYQQQQQNIALVISDIIMPVMGGTEMAHKILAINPKQPLLFISGYAFETGIQDLLKQTNCYHLQKPFSIKDIAETVNAIFRTKNK